MGGEVQDPVSRLAAALRQLYEAAGSPPPSELKRQAPAQIPPVEWPSSTVNDWLLGKSAPSEKRVRVFMSLVEYLTARARRTGSEYSPLTPAQWGQLLKRAQSHRRARRGGRPAGKRRDNASVQALFPGQRQGAQGGSATGGPGSIVNTGIIIGGLPTSRMARSVYLHQVQQIFPWDLVGRDTELADLETFCTSSDGRSYAWWQGPAWAGKSALMAWFVLHPPAEVRVVSFFITSRYAGQSDRAAFLEAVLEQLAELAGQPMPDLLTEANRQWWFGRLLHDAAVACKRDGLHLVLLVDGLDEDRGVTGAPDAHSIAALLPALPPEGVRVIVAGRPDPPVPPDVPQWHPLRDEGIVHSLSISPEAQMVRDDAERELSHLLDGGGLGRMLLGLVTVAGGGLSASDLAELTSESPWMVEKVLRAVSGRTFHGRDTIWQAAGTRVFVLAHEELQQTVVRSLSSDETASLRDRIHDWADQYGHRGWPVRTPEYLLGGYHRLLLEVRDLERMTTLATDRGRLDRMLDISGGDAAALAEITGVQQFICCQDRPDLTSMLKLAITRERLAQRNSNIPVSLPAAWATLGNPTRAEALARSIADPYSQIQALVAVAEALAGAGDLDWAQRLIQQGKINARTVHPLILQESALVAVAEALAKAGDFDQAETIARAITGLLWQASALAAVAEALAKAGEFDQAEVIARSITEHSEQSWALVAVAEALAEAGELDRARQLASHAETIARSITEQLLTA